MLHLSLLSLFPMSPPSMALQLPRFASVRSPADDLRTCSLGRVAITRSIAVKASRFNHLVPISAAIADVNSCACSTNGSASSAATARGSTVDGDDSDVGGRYRLPPPEIKDIVDAPPLPELYVFPHRDKIMFLKRRSLPPLAELARPEIKLAGLRIDGQCNSRSRISFHTGIGIHQLLPDGTLGPEKEVHGLPDGAKINLFKWSHDGRHLAFSILVEEEDTSSSKLRVWIADVETGKSRPLFQSPDIYLNAVFDNFEWLDNSTLVVGTIPLGRGNPPRKPLVPSGPKIQSNEQKTVIQVRRFNDLLKDEYDADLFDYYATSQLVLASLDGEMKEIGPPALYTSVDPSPDGKYLMINSIHRPYSFIEDWESFPKKVDMWTADGKFVRELCDLPLAEDIPITYHSVRKGMRSINWRSDKPSSLYWVETQDGGDAEVAVSPRDIVYTQPAEPLQGEEPEILHKLDLRYGGISWCDDSLALVHESYWESRTWLISPDSKDISPRILSSYPGCPPMLRRTGTGKDIIAKIKKDDDEGTYFLLNGWGANIPFLDLYEINTGKMERIWQSDKEKYYEYVVGLMSDQEDGDLSLNQLKFLITKESKTENPQYSLLEWPDKKACQITAFPHPYPQLATLQKEMIRYRRKDGVQLTATLYLPPNYDPVKDGPLPCLVWAAEDVRGSPNEFAQIGPTSPLLWLARRFAILSQPIIPIIGEEDEGPKDSYLEQLVASAEAAVEEVVRRGVADPKRIAVGGHSYGAFMTANLLAHAPHLFSCGIALSGAYNLTLTPFGFQNEERTIWEAPMTYIVRSPFMFAYKIKTPILLIHGEEDDNYETLPMQSVRFFNALQAHGADCRLVVLPYEGHEFAARESIMHVLWETERWLQKYCVPTASEDRYKKLHYYTAKIV